MKKHALICIIMILLSFLITSHASAYYDTFDSAPMDEEKWRSLSEYLGLEAVRSVSQGKLHLDLRSCNSETIWIHPTAEGTSFVKTDILIDSNSYMPVNSYGHVRLGGWFFNDSRGPGSGQDYNGYEGEFRAEISIILREGSPHSIEAEVWKAEGVLPGTHTVLYSQEFNVSAAFDTVYSLSIESIERTFVFKCNGETLIFTYTPSGPIYASMDNTRAIDNRVIVYDAGECGYLKAKIDNFYNDNSQTPYDSFSGNDLDIAKWLHTELIREIADGKLRMKAGKCNSRGDIGASPTATNESGYLESKVALNDGNISQGRIGYARMGSYFYNEKRGPGSGLDYNGYQDNVFSSIRIRLDENGILKAYALAWRSDHPEEEYGTTLLSEAFDLPIEFGKEYLLSIRFTGSEIIYKCNSETIVYNIQNPTYESYDKNYYLNSRVLNGDQQCGFIDATFDDIAITPVTAVDSDGDGIPDELDDCPNEDATGFDVNSDGCIDSTSGLETILDTLVQDGVIEEELQNSLLSKVENANKSAQKDNICAAINQLEAFKNHVNAQRGKKISDGGADSIIEYADSVIAWLLDQLLPGDTC